MSFYNVQADGSAAERSFRFSEWDSNAALEMCNRVRHLPCAYGGSLGDLIDKTPKAGISKIMTADKVHRTELSMQCFIVLSFIDVVAWP